MPTDRDDLAAPARVSRCSVGRDLDDVTVVVAGILLGIVAVSMGLIAPGDVTRLL